MSGMNCDHCGKGIQRGHNVSHSKRRTAKTWRPNLQVLRYRESINENRKTIRLCISCLRRAKENMKKLAQRETIAKIHAPKISAPQITT